LPIKILNNSSLPQGKLSLFLTFLIRLDAILKSLGLPKIFKASLFLAIRVYKRYISPHKGFACAYRVLHQQQSCSSYFQTCITEQSFTDACLSFQQRLQACHQANLVLQSSRPKRKPRRRGRKNSCMENNNCFDCRDLVEVGWFFSFFNPFECMDCGDCDF